jgi:hypothetical protein
MTDETTDLDHLDEDILTCNVSDDALESAAGTDAPMISWADTLSLTLRPCC